MSERGMRPPRGGVVKEGNPNFSQRNPSRGGRKSKENRKEIQIKSLNFLRRIECFQGVTPTPKAFFLFWAASGLKGASAA
jgi:hypothetical protein